MGLCLGHNVGHGLLLVGCWLAVLLGSSVGCRRLRGERRRGGSGGSRSIRDGYALGCVHRRKRRCVVVAGVLWLGLLAVAIHRTITASGGAVTAVRGAVTAVRGSVTAV